MPVESGVRIFQITCFVLLSGLLLAVSDGRAQHTRTLTKTVDLPSDGEVELNTVTGKIQVAPWDRAAVELEIRIEGEDSERVQTLDVQIDEGERQLTVRTGDADPDGPGIWALLGLEGDHEGPKTDVTLRMPATAALAVTTQSASVAVRGLTNEVVVEANDSSIHLSDLEGRTVVGTLSGGLQAENIRGELVVGTMSGNLQMRLPAPPPTTQIGSFSGNAEIVLPADAAFDLRTDITWGGMSSDFPIPDSSAQSDGPVSVGGGGPTIAFESFSGTLTLRAE